MPRLDPTLRPALRTLHELASQQAGVCTRAQAIAAGVSPAAIARRTRAGTWISLHPGVYQTEPSRAEATARVWAAHLALGPGSVIAGRAAGHIWGLLDGSLDPDEPVHVLLPERLRLRAQGVVVRRVPQPLDWAHPARRPQVLTVEHAVLDLVRLAPDDADAVEVILRACRTRSTSPPRILAAAATRARIKRRALVREVCEDVGRGVSSPLERRYRRDVALAHGLPSAVAQQPASTWSGRRIYRDLHYDAFGVLVELDGRLGHEREAEVLRDQFRDNAAALTGLATLRFGWLAVAGHPCDVAAQVAALLRLRGWRGSVRPCGPGCTADPRWRRAA